MLARVLESAVNTEPQKSLIGDDETLDQSRRGHSKLMPNTECWVLLRHVYAPNMPSYVLLPLVLEHFTCQGTLSGPSMGIWVLVIN